MDNIENQEEQVNSFIPKFEIENLVGVFESIQHYIPFMEKVNRKLKIQLNKRYVLEYLDRCVITKKSCNCVVCLEFISQKHKVIRLHCNHEFHYDCISEWFSYSYSCPVCKRSIQEFESRINDHY